MEQPPEIKQQRGNLLDKFIRNEKKAKLWAALSLLTFCATASTVLVVAYQLKNGKDTVQTETPVPDIKTDSTQTVVITEDTSTIRIINEQAATIAVLADSVHDLQVKYEERVKEVDMYIDLWKECQGGITKQPPAIAQPLSVMIYTVKASGTAIEKIMEIIRRSGAAKNGVTFNTATAPATIDTKLTVKQNPVIVARQNPAIAEKKFQPTVDKQLTRKVSTQPAQRYYAGIKYFDVKYANEAATIAYELNSNSNIFANWQQLNVIKADVSESKADIEIWLVAVGMNTK
jgi:hypothetical protein